MDNLVSPRRVREIIKKYSLYPRKKYGQNFLIDQNILDKVLEAGQLAGDDRVLEVGPGIGTLTRALSPRVKQVVGVEIDRGLVRVLRETLRNCHNVTVIPGDILKKGPGELVGPCWGKESYKVISNLPYNITTPLLSRLLREGDNISLMVCMVQREAAERITAPPGGKTYGPISVLARYYAEPELLFTVPRTVFFPSPEVDSAVIRLREKKVRVERVEDEELFYQIVRRVFQYRRKSLLNALKGASGLGRHELGDLISRAGLNPSCRGETLSEGEFANLANIIYNSKGFVQL